MQGLGLPTVPRSICPDSNDNFLPQLKNSFQVQNKFPAQISLQREVRTAVINSCSGVLCSRVWFKLYIFQCQQV